MRPIFIIYHKDCPDGFSAAWTAWKKFGSKAEYVAVNPGKLPKKFPQKREIYVLDVCYPEKILRKMGRENKSLMVIDHHLSNVKDIHAATSYIMDMTHSTAVLSWKYFHPGEKVPRLLSRVEDLDLWRFAFPETYLVGLLAKNIIRYDFKSWEFFVSDFENPRKRKNF